MGRTGETPVTREVVAVNEVVSPSPGPINSGLSTRGWVVEINPANRDANIATLIRGRSDGGF